jgi:hypothetical protein
MIEATRTIDYGILRARRQHQYCHGVTTMQRANPTPKAQRGLADTGEQTTAIPHHCRRKSAL